jgi:diadenosine tetraphosphate (Ap4A) HIT family hydrolase
MTRQRLPPEPQHRALSSARPRQPRGTRCDRRTARSGVAENVEIEYESFDFEALRERLGGRCFICELLAGNPEFRHDVFYENAVAFLNKYPSLYGYSLVAPKQHREAVTADFHPDEYLALQEVVYRVGEAIRRTVPAERLYILSLGSQEGNRHVHWHVAPLPPGVPFEQQQPRGIEPTRPLADQRRRNGRACAPPR